MKLVSSSAQPPASQQESVITMPDIPTPESVEEMVKRLREREQHVVDVNAGVEPLVGYRDPTAKELEAAAMLEALVNAVEVQLRMQEKADHVSPTPPEGWKKVADQHINWLLMYAEGATEADWRDMLARIRKQVGELSDHIDALPAAPPAPASTTKAAQ